MPFLEARWFSKFYSSRMISSLLSILWLMRQLARTHKTHVEHKLYVSEYIYRRNNKLYESLLESYSYLWMLVYLINVELI